MELGAAGLQEQPFRTHGKPLAFVNYEGAANAFRALEETCRHPLGLLLLEGPELSGKTTILREFVESLKDDIACAVVDGAGLNTGSLLATMLGQFGYELQFNSTNELLNMLRVFAQQQAAGGQPPLLIVENTQAMSPGALHVLCELAELRVRTGAAIHMVLASDGAIDSIVRAPAMECIGNRISGHMLLEPLAENEIRQYVYTKLRSGGCFDPENVIPEAVCRHLHAVSGGWPGVIDRLILLAIARAPFCPIEIEHIETPKIPATANGSAGLDNAEGAARGYTGPPRLFVTLHGKTLKETVIDRPRILIGRSEHNDLCINSKFISRHHALFVRHGTATILMDLNSTNGTFVNSRRVTNHVMANEDVISLGNYSIKFVDPHAHGDTTLDGAGIADTVIMKSLQDMRRLLARENTQVVPELPAEAASGDPDN